MSEFQNNHYPLPAMTVVLPILSFTAIVLEIPPLLWHLQNRNFGASWLIFWLLMCQVFYFMNPVIWPRDNIDAWWDGSGLCDIEARIFLASTVGIPGSITCIIRRLAHILNTDKAVMAPSKPQRMWNTILDLLLCVGFPSILMIVYYVVQPIRYFIFTTTGCDWATQPSWPSIVVISIWPLLLCVINAFYAVVVIYRVYRYRKSLGGIFDQASTTKSRFFRLLAISVLIIFVNLPLAIHGAYYPYRDGLIPFNWETVHSYWIVVPQPTFGRFPHWDSIVYAVAGYLVFLFFGLGHDARGMYKGWISSTGLDKYFSPSRNSADESAKGSKITLLRSSRKTKGNLEDKISSPVKEKRDIYRLSTLTFESGPISPAKVQVPHEQV